MKVKCSEHRIKSSTKRTAVARHTVWTILKMLRKHFTMTRGDPLICTTRSVDSGAHSV